jgi:8-oxo-dGTP pyrophosphatase MutT (NUDIX family)
VFDDERRLLVLENDEGEYELPGGGWEHGESFAECIAREIDEELHASVASVGDIVFTYGKVSLTRGYHVIRLVAHCTLSTFDFRPDDSIVSARYVDRAEFLLLDLQYSEGNLHDFVDKIWDNTKE